MDRGLLSSGEVWTSPKLWSQLRLIHSVRLYDCLDDCGKLDGVAHKLVDYT